MKYQTWRTIILNSFDLDKIQNLWVFEVVDYNFSLGDQLATPKVSKLKVPSKLINFLNFRLPYLIHHF